MRREETLRPSFPAAALNSLLTPAQRLRWQVLCGDEGSWRVGVYSPPEASPADCRELERHDCPELFLLLSGRMSLLLAEGGGLRELVLDPGKPALITAPHCGFCPDGPHTGVALVVERDAFATEFAPPEAWLARRA